jgi:hypothetical protein
MFPPLLAGTVMVVFTVSCTIVLATKVILLSKPIALLETIIEVSL